MIRPLIFILLAALAVGADAQKAPTVQPKVDWATLADFTARTNDIISTTRAMQCTCNKEDFLPHAIAYHPVVMAVYSEGVFVGNWFIARKLREDGHPHWATAYQIGDAVYDGVLGGKNWTLPGSAHGHAERFLAVHITINTR